MFYLESNIRLDCYWKLIIYWNPIILFESFSLLKWIFLSGFNVFWLDDVQFWALIVSSYHCFWHICSVWFLRNCKRTVITPKLFPLFNFIIIIIIFYEAKSDIFVLFMSNLFKMHDGCDVGRFINMISDKFLFNL